MSELENDAPVEEVTPEVAAGPEDQQETVESAPIDQDKINHAFAKKQAKLKEAKEARDAAQARNKELEARIAEFEKPGLVDVPPMPDQYDDESVYAEKMRSRDAALTRNAEVAAQQKLEQSKQEQDQQRKQQEAQQRITAQAATYAERAETLGISKEDLAKSGNVIVNAGVPDDLVDYLLDDEDGPVLSNYLAANPMVLDELAHMNPMQRGGYVERKIRAAANGLKPKPSTTPDPAESVNGRGVPEGKRGTEGATYE